MAQEGKEPHANTGGARDTVQLCFRRYPGRQQDNCSSILPENSSCRLAVHMGVTKSWTLEPTHAPHPHCMASWVLSDFSSKSTGVFTAAPEIVISKYSERWELKLRGPVVISDGTRVEAISMLPWDPSPEHWVVWKCFCRGSHSHCLGRSLECLPEPEPRLQCETRLICKQIFVEWGYRKGVGTMKRVGAGSGNYKPRVPGWVVWLPTSSLSLCLCAGAWSWLARLFSEFFRWDSAASSFSSNCRSPAEESPQVGPCRLAHQQEACPLFLVGPQYWFLWNAFLSARWSFCSQRIQTSELVLMVALDQCSSAWLDQLMAHWFGTKCSRIAFLHLPIENFMDFVSHTLVAFYQL